MRGQQRQQAQLGGGQCRRSGSAGTAFLRQPGPERLSLAGQGAQAGPGSEHLIDLPHERPGPGQVAEREVDAGELGPGLDGEVGQGISQQMVNSIYRELWASSRS